MGDELLWFTQNDNNGDGGCGLDLFSVVCDACDAQKRNTAVGGRFGRRLLVETIFCVDPQSISLLR